MTKVYGPKSGEAIEGKSWTKFFDPLCETGAYMYTHSLRVRMYIYIYILYNLIMQKFAGIGLGPIHL